MISLRTTAATGLAITLILGAGAPAFSQGVQGQQRWQHMQQGMPMQPDMPGQMPGMMGQGMGPGMMGEGMMWQGRHMMSPEEMQALMEQMHGMMEGSPMMGRGWGHGSMMGEGMGPRMGGWSGLEGRRVVPMPQLTPDDVRGFLERHLEAVGNPRLKVGKVEAADERTITAEIVTVDDSLVERFAVDRRTGLISAAG